MSNRRRAIVLFVIGVLLVCSSSVMLSPLYEQLFGDYCSPFEMWSFRRDARSLIAKLADAEETINATGQMPIYLEAELTNSIRQTETMRVPACALDAYQYLACAMRDGSAYLSRKANEQESGNPQTEKYFNAYRDCLIGYHLMMDDIDACLPFCQK